MPMHISSSLPSEINFRFLVSKRRDKCPNSGVNGGEAAEMDEELYMCITAFINMIQIYVNELVLRAAFHYSVQYIDDSFQNTTLV